jgi:hypothetical protein
MNWWEKFKSPFFWLKVRNIFKRIMKGEGADGRKPIQGQKPGHNYKPRDLSKDK